MGRAATITTAICRTTAGTGSGGSAQAPGFLGSALRTTAGVAGGVVLADMLTGMFHHSQPQEIVNTIEEPPVQDLNPADSSFLDNNNQGFDSNQPSWEDASLCDNNLDSGFGSDDMGSDDFNDDDDSFF